MDILAEGRGLGWKDSFPGILRDAPGWMVDSFAAAVESVVIRSNIRAGISKLIKSNVSDYLSMRRRFCCHSG